MPLTTRLDFNQLQLISTNFTYFSTHISERKEQTFSTRKIIICYLCEDLQYFVTKVHQTQKIAQNTRVIHLHFLSQIISNAKKMYTFLHYTQKNLKIWPQITMNENHPCFDDLYQIFRNQRRKIK